IDGVDGGAIAALEDEAFRRHPSDGFLADLAAARRLAAGDSSAASWIDRALLLGPRDGNAHALAASALVAAGHPDQAALELGVALTDASSRDLAARGDLALALFPAPQDERLASALPVRAEVYAHMLDRLAYLHRWAAAERVGRDAIAFVPDDPRLL